MGCFTIIVLTVHNRLAQTSLAEACSSLPARFWKADAAGQGPTPPRFLAPNENVLIPPRAVRVAWLAAAARRVPPAAPAAR